MSRREKRSEHAADEAASGADAAGKLRIDTASQRAYEASRAHYHEGTLDRETARLARAQIADERDVMAAARDESARLRDLSADTRDREAAEDERVADERERGAVRPGAAHESSAALRAQAATVRAQASSDRECAARDRAAAARDREHFHNELQRAHLDQLTGAYGRRMGEIVIRHEIERARRARSDLVLAYVDVDELKATNDRRGHAAGDTMLREVVAAIGSKLRPYDPVTRWGGDEFLCAMSDATIDSAGKRCDEAREVLATSSSRARFSQGLAALAEGDTLETLVERADRSLLAARRGR